MNQIKSFLNPSAITDFHAALGQFLNYRLGLQITESDRPLYLAVTIDTYKTFFQEIFVQEAVKIYQVKLLVYDPLKEEIVEWKN
ncbi:MAG: fatty-acid oxidation protein subunit alpha [Scytonematopsis contorta HA4267-MV1]|nr:fatty-acid oxidation protein subunit alpha [Scytonematopsis contorta HA4267-MV1]